MRLNTIQILTNSAITMSMIFIPMLADELGASHFEIGLIMAVYSASLFVSSLIFGRMADAVPARLLVYAGLGASAVSFLAQAFAGDAFGLAIARAAAGFSIGIFPSAMLLYAYTMKRNMGKYISFGSLGWATGNFLAGMLADYFAIFTVSSLFFALSFAIALTLPYTERPRQKIDYYSFGTIRQHMDIYLTFMFRHIGATAVWTIFPLYLAGLGADKFWVGIIYMSNAGLQFIFMRRLERWGSERLIRYGAVLSMLAFLSFIPITSHFQAFAGMALVALSWSCLYVGSVSYLMENSVEKATSTGFLNSVQSFSSIIGGLIGGTVSGAFASEMDGYRAVLLAAAVMSLAGFVNFGKKEK